MSTASMTEEMAPVTIKELLGEMENSYLYSLKNDRRCWAYMIWGPPGIGKTAAISQLRDRVEKSYGSEVKFVAHASATYEPWDFNGPLVKHGEYSDYSPMRWIYEASTEHPDNSPMIVFLDDLATAPPQTQAAAFKLIHELKVGGMTLRNNVLIVAAGNRMEDASATHAMPRALANRFRNRVLREDVDGWLEHAMNNRFHPLTMSYVKTHPSDLSSAPSESQSIAFVTPRAWENLSDFLWEQGDDVVERASTGHPWLAQVAGIVGPGVALQFDAHVVYAKSAVPPQEIVKNPDKAKVPDEAQIDVVWATMINLEAYIKQHNEHWLQALKYSLRDDLMQEAGIQIGSAALRVLLMDLDIKERMKLLGDPKVFEVIEKFEERYKTERSFAAKM